MRLHYEVLTQKQRECYDWIVAYVERHAEWPTFRDIQAGLGLSSPNNVTQYMKALVRKGWLVKRDSHYDFAQIEMPYLTPQLRGMIQSKLAEELGKYLDEAQAEEIASKAIEVTLTDLPATSSSKGSAPDED